MALHLVTGYKGIPHITAADQGAFNAGLVGSGDYVLTSGNNLKAQVISNNIIRIYDGDVLMQGRHINLKANTYDDVEIANGIQTMNRNDIIAIRYSKDVSTGIEKVEFVVIQGVSTNDAAKDPKLTTGNILSDDTVHEMPIYRVSLSGLNIKSIEPMFSLTESSISMEDKINSLISQLGGWSIKVVDNLPTESEREPNTLYFSKN